MPSIILYNFYRNYEVSKFFLVFFFFLTFFPFGACSPFRTLPLKTHNKTRWRPQQGIMGVKFSLSLTVSDVATDVGTPHNRPRDIHGAPVCGRWGDRGEAPDLRNCKRRARGSGVVRRELPGLPGTAPRRSEGSAGVAGGCASSLWGSASGWGSPGCFSRPSAAGTVPASSSIPRPTHHTPA